ncbi:MAG TPA: hypothetical protein VMH34_05550 [Gammaproteobacteria bacterium]|nr:hypothetical protein [Gammaproteobacteria bacterium]
MKYLDTGSIIIIAITLFLFLLALFLKGLTHDLLLEAGVFLVSVKLILLGYKNSVLAQTLEQEMKEIKSLLRAPNPRQDGKNRPD